MFDENFLQRALLGLPILIFSLTVHEFSHAWSAKKFGDDTAERMGRLTLNPLAHLDFLGTLMMVMSGFRFGWAKPVPVNPYNLRNPRVADFAISFAGPASNFIIAICAGTIFRMIDGSSEMVYNAQLFFLTMVQINVFLGLFNLVPLFPLDGSHMLRSALGEKWAPTLDQFNRIAPFILLALIIFNLLWVVLGPPASFLIHLFVGV